jgi:hypothetical protein
MNMQTPSIGTWKESRDALLRATLALTVDQRIDWLEEMIAIAVESGALPKRVPDQETARRLTHHNEVTQ